MKANIEWRSKEAPQDWLRMRNLEAMGKIKSVEIIHKLEIKITIDTPGPMMGRYRSRRTNYRSRLADRWAADHVGSTGI